MIKTLSSQNILKTIVPDYRYIQRAHEKRLQFYRLSKCINKGKRVVLPIMKFGNHSGTQSVDDCNDKTTHFSNFVSIRWTLLKVSVRQY